MKGFEVFSENRAQSEWSSVYMLIVLIIVALLLITIIKPLFQEAGKKVKKNPIASPK
jgi:competence protein ComGC